MPDDEDRLPGSEPYTNDQLKDPAFDPFEAHRQWIARRAAITPAQRQAQIDAALKRLDKHMAAWREEEKKPKKRKKKINLPSELDRWKKALAEVKKH